LFNRCYMKFFRLLSLILLVAIAVSWLSHTGIPKYKETTYKPGNGIKKKITGNILQELKQKAEEAKLFVHRKGYNEKLCFLINMSLPSGENRFFVYNMKTDSLQAQGLVAHGNCFEYGQEGRRYSNVVGSGCTSLGKYRIGIPYTGKFGYSYKLQGLDSSNNNAFERTVVLHAHSCIPETEVAEEICQSNGCPMVSPNFLVQLKKIINTSKKPVMLWIYE